MTSATSKLELLSQYACAGGTQSFYAHPSDTVGLPMRFGVFLPPTAGPGNAVPAILYLAGLTCNEETFFIKAGAQQFAAQHGLALISADTSPRGANVAGEATDWDFGVGAGFYLNAIREPWAKHWQMESYLTKELMPLLGEHLPIDTSRLGIMGHSMGGHGALTLAYRHPGMFKSLSAFAPICAASLCPWGDKAFTGYLGDDRALWAEHDACQLILHRHRQGQDLLYPQGMLVDQGCEDKFLEVQLQTDKLVQACDISHQPLQVRMHPKYDHSYYFVQSFMADHVAFHAQNLRALGSAAG